MMKAMRAAAMLLMVATAIVWAQDDGGYHVVRKTMIGGEGFWDYLYADSPARRLYVTHGDHVVVLNLDDLKVVGEIPHTDGVHGVAVAPEFGHGFTSNGRSSTVTLFDLKTLNVLKEVPVTGKNPDAILYDPFSKSVFTFNGRSADATVLSPSTGDTVATVPLGGKPEFAVTDLHGRIYVNIEDKSEIACIDARSHRVVARWAIAPGESPSGLAIDEASHRLFSVCENGLMVVSDPESQKVVATVPIGRGPDACKFDPGTQTVFSSNGEGTITVIREESPTAFVVVENAKTEPRARTMEVDTQTHALFTVTAQFGETPKPTAEHPRPRPAMVPNTFVLLELQK
jgi:DNA-binding beta-propeller fold protein YncE